MTLTLTLLLWSGLACGNFFVQAFGYYQWGVAAERSFFQLIAMLLMWVWIKK